MSVEVNGQLEMDIHLLDSLGRLMARPLHDY